MVWDDLVYEDEIVLPDGTRRDLPDKVSVNKNLFDHYKKLIGIRNDLPALRTGSFETVLVDDPRQLYGFKRKLDGQEVIVLLNNSDSAHDAEVAGKGNWEDRLSGDRVAAENGSLKVSLPPKGAAIFVRS